MRNLGEGIRRGRQGVRLQIRKRQLEFQIVEKEIIDNFTMRITRLMNQVKACGVVCCRKKLVFFDGKIR